MAATASVCGVCHGGVAAIIWPSAPPGRYGWRRSGPALRPSPTPRGGGAPGRPRCASVEQHEALRELALAWHADESPAVYHKGACTTGRGASPTPYLVVHYARSSASLPPRAYPGPVSPSPRSAVRRMVRHWSRAPHSPRTKLASLPLDGPRPLRWGSISAPQGWRQGAPAPTWKVCVPGAQQRHGFYRGSATEDERQMVRRPDTRQA